MSVPTKIHLANLIYAKSCNKYVTYRITSVEGQDCLITTTKLVFQDRDGGYLFKLYCYMCVIEVVTVVVFENFPRRIFSLTQNSHHHAKTCFKRVVFTVKNRLGEIPELLKNSIHSSYLVKLQGIFSKKIQK